MSVTSISLRKLLTIMFANKSQKISILRSTIRNDIKKSRGEKSGGGDFHVPFWYDAKRHINNERNLHVSVAERIAANSGRRRLYPKLRDEFLSWWNEKRRWINEPISSEILNPKGVLLIPELSCSIKIENLLAKKIGDSDFRVVYPYFSETPVLARQSARLGLWALDEALADFARDQLRILDVMRGKSFSFEDIESVGTEAEEFINRYRSVLSLYEQLLAEYEPR